MADRQVSVNRAFSSYAGDGSGEQRYFTAGNAHEIEGFVSDEEFKYRQEGETPYITVVEAVELPDPVFQRPEEPAAVTTAQPAARTSARRRAADQGTTSES